MRYTMEQRKKVLDAFIKKFGSFPTPTQIEREGGRALFVQLIGSPMTSSGIWNFLKKSEDPEEYSRIAKSRPSYINKSKKKQPTSSNTLFDLISDKAYILVPSHGDIFCFDTTQEVQEAIEKSQSSNMSMIKFKLLKALPIKVSTKVSCQIG